MKIWNKILIGVGIAVGVIIFIIVVMALFSRSAKKGTLLDNMQTKRKIFPEGTQVFYVNNGDDYEFSTKEQAAKGCSRFDAELANYDDLKEAYARGAEWCAYGWIKEGRKVYPMRDNASGCQGKAGIVEGNPSKAGAICVGKKPPLGTNAVFPFRPGVWNMNEF